MSEQPKSTEQRAASEQPAPDALSYEQARDELTKVVAAVRNRDAQSGDAGATDLESE